jgi:hypothetical protein
MQKNSKYKMSISQRIIWYFSESYISREHSFLSRKPKFFTYSPAIFIIGFARILRLYFLQKSMKMDIIDVPDHVVVKTAAPHMHMNYFSLFNQNNDRSKYFYIESFNSKQFTQIKRLNFWDIFIEFHLTFKEFNHVFSRLSPEEMKSYALEQASVSLSVFSYFTCLFKNLKNENSNIKIFSGGAHLISAAAITAGARTYWLSHGLIAQARLQGADIKQDPLKYYIPIPQYDYIYLYSKDEKTYLSDHGVSSQIMLYDFEKIENLKNKLVIFMPCFDSSIDFQELAMLIDLFKKYNYKIIIKLHISYIGGMQLEFAKSKNLSISKSVKTSGSELMRSERPKFIAGWSSTTLCEALRQGIIPIDLWNITRDQHQKFSPYNFRKRTIWWQEDQEALLKLLDDSDKKLIEKFVDTMS